MNSLQWAKDDDKHSAWGRDWIERQTNQITSSVTDNLMMVWCGHSVLYFSWGLSGWGGQALIQWWRSLEIIEGKGFVEDKIRKKRKVPH